MSLWRPLAIITLFFPFELNKVGFLIAGEGDTTDEHMAFMYKVPYYRWSSQAHREACWWKIPSEFWLLCYPGLCTVPNRNHGYQAIMLPSCSQVLQRLPVFGIHLLALFLPDIFPDSKFHGANMGPTWVLSAPDGPHVGPMNLATRVFSKWLSVILTHIALHVRRE